MKTNLIKKTSSRYGHIKGKHRKYIKYHNCKHLIGEKSQSWKGDKVGISALHRWIRRHYGNPKKCDHCNKEGEYLSVGKNKRKLWSIDFANISGKYKRNIKDFKRLCKRCHNRFDINRKARGIENGRAKLTEKNILEIRNLYIPRKYPLEKIAKKFKVYISTIHKIVKKEHWKHI